MPSHVATATPAPSTPGPVDRTPLEVDDAQTGTSSYTGPVTDWQVEHPLVLVVDVDEDTPDQVATGLERDGLTAVTAANAEDALAIADARPVAAVILDVLMPGVDGHELCRMLREGPLGAGVPVIMLTALDTLDSELDSVLSGADAYLTKPIRSTDLIARLQDLL